MISDMWLHLSRFTILEVGECSPTTKSWLKSDYVNSCPLEASPVMAHPVCVCVFYTYCFFGFPKDVASTDDRVG